MQQVILPVAAAERPVVHKLQGADGCAHVTRSPLACHRRTPDSVQCHNT